MRLSGCSHAVFVFECRAHLCQAASPSAAGLQGSHGDPERRAPMPLLSSWASMLVIRQPPPEAETVLPRTSAVFSPSQHDFDDECT